MKKRILLFSLLTLMLVLVACNGNNGNDKDNLAELLNEAHEALNIPGDLNNIKADITLPLEGINNVTISWESSDEETIDVEGKVTRPTFEDGNKTVTLTATLSLGNESKFKEFEVIVIALDEVINAELQNLIVTTFAQKQGALLMVAPSIDSNAVVYYVITTEEVELSSEDIIEANHEMIVSSGSQKGGFRGYQIEGLTPNETHYVYAVAVVGDKHGEIRSVEAISSDYLFWGGENPSVIGYFPIYNLRDLEEFNRGYNIGEYSRFSNIKLMNDIDMSEEYGPGLKSWEPLNQPGDTELGIDPAQTEYHGIFDGNNKTINGLYIESSDDFVGFFKKIDLKQNYSLWDPEKDAGVIKNLTFTNPVVIATFDENNPKDGDKVLSARGVGVLAGWFRGHKVDNVKILGGKVERIGIASSTENGTGGLFGLVQSHGFDGDARGDTSVIISNVVTDIEVIGYQNVGGIVGMFDDGWSAGSHEMVIRDSYSLGKTIGHDYVGGIAGSFRGVMENVIAYGEVVSEKNGAGVIGYFHGLRRGSDRYESTIKNIFAFNYKVTAANYSKVFYATKSSLTIDRNPEWFPHQITIEGVYYFNKTIFEGSERTKPTVVPFDNLEITRAQLLEEFTNILENWEVSDHETYGQIMILK